MKDEIFELKSVDSLRNEAVFNDDIAPSTRAQRTWNKWHIAALWVGMSICVPTYTLGGVLTAFFGLSVSEALFTIFFANAIILIPLCLNAVPGTKYGIPFPVLLRSSFGIRGSNLPAILRALVACGWFGIQTMFGGLAIDILFDNLIPGWESLGGFGHVIGFFIFWALNIYVVISGFESIKKLESFAAPLLLIVGLILLFWGIGQVDMVEVINTPANRPEDASFWGFFFGGLTAMVGFWATLALNIPDFSRYAKSQKDQVVGQIIGLPITMFLFSALGVIMTAASINIFGEAISDPISLIGKMDNSFLIIISMVMIIIATISTNTAANIVSPTNDFQNMIPNKINMKKGVILTGIIGIILMLWDLLRIAGLVEGDGLEGRYVGWLLGYSSLLGPVAGIMIVDFFIIRQQNLVVEELYKVNSSYGSIRLSGVLAWIIPVIFAIIGLGQEPGSFLHGLYNYGWFTGALIGGVLYWVFSKTLNK